MPSVAGFAPNFDRFRPFNTGPSTSSRPPSGRVRSGLKGLQDEVRSAAFAAAARQHLPPSRRRPQRGQISYPVSGHLPDPLAAHGQGLLFLECLFDCWKDRLTHPSAPLDDGNWLVRSEFHVPGFGILDLLIENDKKKYVLVIENKIGSDDHGDQLPRYREWMDMYRQGWTRQLVYLTPNGRCPTLSICSECLSRTGTPEHAGRKNPARGAASAFRTIRKSGVS